MSLFIDLPVGQQVRLVADRRRPALHVRHNFPRAGRAQTQHSRERSGGGGGRTRDEGAEAAGHCAGQLGAGAVHGPVPGRLLCGQGIGVKGGAPWEGKFSGVS